MPIENRGTVYQELAIRERAYLIWECSGGPAGEDLEHWLKAEKEIEYEHPRSWAEVVLEQGSDWPLCPRGPNRDGGAMAEETVARLIAIHGSRRRSLSFGSAGIESRPRPDIEPKTSPGRRPSQPSRGDNIGVIPPGEACAR